MKHKFIIIISAVFLLLSCNNVNIELGSEVNSVAYSITDNDSIKDTNNYRNSNVTVLSESTESARNVSPILPVRKGFIFTNWQNIETDSKYEAGGNFVKDDENKDIKLQANFTPNTSKYFTSKDLFELSIDDIAPTGLATHRNGSKSELPLQSSIPIKFVSIPGGYAFSVITISDEKYNVSASNSALSIVGLNKGGNDNIKTWAIEDYALSETEVPSALFKIVTMWNEQNNKGYDFGFDRVIYPEEANENTTVDTTDFTDLPYYGVYYDSSDGNKPKNRYSAYDPVSCLPWDTAVVFCNALTEWYNQRYNEHLSYAYTRDGKSSGMPIKSVKDDAMFLRNIGSDDRPSLEQGNIDGSIPHVQGATGFRLPTSAEWTFAATIVPDPKTEIGVSKLDSYTYPNVIAHNIVSGRIKTNDETYAYAITSDVYGPIKEQPDEVVPDSGTDVVGQKSVKDQKNAARKIKRNSPNSIGLYDMSGNVKEYTETLVSGGSPEKSVRVALGGGFDNTNEECVPSYSFSNKYKDNIMSEDGNTYNTQSRYNLSSLSYGFRLARTIGTTEYKYYEVQ